MKTNCTLILFMFSLLFVTSCNDTDGTSVTSGTYAITILEPTADLSPLGHTATIAGDCGFANYPIVINGDVSLRSVCQPDNTWSAVIPGQGFSEGQTVTVNVTLWNPNYTTSSSTEVRTFSKLDVTCDDPANLSKTFGNIDAGGNGGAIPYKICNATQFANIAIYPGANYSLGANINFGHARHNPFTQTFTGELDGNDFRIENMLINEAGSTAVGIFKSIQGGSVKNLKLKNITVIGNSRVGVLAGDWRGIGTIDNVSVEGTVNATSMAGGLVGLANTDSALTIINSKIDVDVVASGDFAGGVVSYVFANSTNFTMNNTEVYGNVTGQSYVGGAVGRFWQANANMTNVLHKGDVNASGKYVGGLVGEAYHGVNLNTSRHIGSVTVTRNATNADMNVGGLIGVTRATSNITSSYVVSNITAGGDYAAGLVGRYFGGSVTGSYARGTLNVDDTFGGSTVKFVGGLFGNINTDSTLDGSYSLMDITADAEYVGGLVGFFGGSASTIINGSYSVGTIVGEKNFIGGLVGQFLGASINNSFSRSNITVNNAIANSYVGGVVGYVNNTSTYNMIYNSGDITIASGLADNVGGAFGYVKANSISNVFTSGTLTGARSNVGGIAGYLRANLDSAMSNMSLTGSYRNLGGIAGIAYQVNISNSLFTGTVTGEGIVGGIVGLYFPNLTTISTSYVTGTLNKSSGSASQDSTFGPIGGSNLTNDNITNGLFLDTMVMNDIGMGAPIFAPNLYGTAKNSVDLQSSINYDGFDFGAAWKMPSVGFSLPSEVPQYNMAIMQWMDQAEFGFVAAATFGDDPINEPDPEVIPEIGDYESLALEFGQDLIDEVTSLDPVSSVVVGNLEVSIDYPAVAGETILNRMLVHGECGQAGNTIQVSGSFDQWTICQDNNRWAAVINASALPAGNVTLSVDLKDNALGAGSPVISRTLNKPVSVCNDPLAIAGEFGNSHLGGNGGATPYVICHRGQFLNIGYYPTANFELGNDVDFTDSVITPFSSEFTGELNGKGFRVRNYVINQGIDVGSGIFKTIGSGAVIKDIQLLNFNIAGEDKSGALTGTWNGIGTIEDVTISGTVSGTSNVGGLIGYASASSALTLTNLTSTVTVTGNDYIGGVIGYVQSNDGSFSASNMVLHNTVNGYGQTGYVGGFIGNLQEPTAILNSVTQDMPVSSTGMYVGGLVGEMNGGSITTCSNTGNITVTTDGNEGFIGGAIGRSVASLAINNCTYNGTIHAGSDNVGGIIGYQQQGSIINTSTAGLIEVDDLKYNVPRSYVGGIIGRSENDVNLSLTASNSSMFIDANAQYVGGVAGRIPGNGSVMTDVYATGDITAKTKMVGGLAGFYMGDVLYDSYATGSVTVTDPTPGSYIGGLIGYTNSWNADLQRVYATGNVTVNTGTADYVGGLVGFFRGGDISQSYAQGNVGGDAVRNSSGGLVGMMRGNVTESYATGDVTCKGNNCGGLLGYLLNSTATKNFAIGNVESFGRGAGLIGFINHGSTNVVQHNYAYGIVTRAAGSSEPLGFFGPLVSDELTPGAFDVTTNIYINENLGASHNSDGVGIADLDAPNTSYYSGFPFASMTVDWMSAPIGYELYSGFSYGLPILDWMGGGGGGSSLYNISGTLAGLEFDSLEITLNGSESIIKTPGQTSFAFTSQIAEGQSYNVTITTQPSAPPITCLVTNGSGTVSGGDVTDIAVDCPTVTAINLIAPLASLNLGQNQTLQVDATFSDLSNQDIAPYVTWSEGTPGIFSLAQSGLLTAQNEGSSIITADFLTFSDNESISSVAVPTQVVITTQPGNTQSGSNISPSIIAEIRDFNNNIINTATNQVSIVFNNDPSSGSATLSGTTVKNAVNGVVTFDNISIDIANSGYSFFLVSTGLTSANTNSFDIQVGPKDSLVYNVQPAGGISGDNFANFSVEIVDAYGNRTNDSDSISLAFQNDPSSGSATLSGTTTVPAVNGLATFADISVDFGSSGYTLQATATGVSSVTSNSFNIFAVPTKVIFVSQPAATLAGNTLPSFQVAISDDFNNIITNSSDNISISFDNDPTSGSAILSGTLSANAVNGVVTFNDISIDLAESSYTFRAVSSGLTDAVSNGFNVTLSGPTLLTLLDPVSSPSVDSTPTITVDGVENGDSVDIYLDPSCTTSVASFTSPGNSVDVTTNILPEGSYVFYAQRVSGSVQSLCSTANLAYEVQGSFNQLDTMDGFGNWSNVLGDDADWIINSGNTPIPDVGPSTGTYALMWADDNGRDDILYLESNVVDGATYDLAFTFDWNKRGTNMGDLILEASSDGGASWAQVWSHLGTDVPTAGVDVWRPQFIDLCTLGYNSSTVALRFTGIMPAQNPAEESDIALDNLNITSGGCVASPPATVTFDSPGAGTTITAFNMNSFPIGGSCSDDGQNVSLAGDVFGSTSCSAGSWSMNVDSSVAVDGYVNFIVTHNSGSGGANGQTSRDFFKDSTSLYYDSMDNFNHWANVAYDDFDWSLESGETESIGVGPSSAQGNGGSYAYTEASGAGGGKEFILETADMDAASFNLRFDFYWNKRGTKMGDLYLEASTDGGASWDASVWSHIDMDIPNDGVDVWRNQSIDLCNLGYSSGNVRLRFRAVMPGGGQGWNSDIGVDELKISNDGCNPGTPATIAITSPDAGSTNISILNQDVFTVSGTCSDNGQNITFLGDVSGSTTCVGTAWSYNFNMSSLPDGNVLVIADHISATGGPTGRAIENFTKDTTLLQRDDFDVYINWANVGGDNGDWTLNFGETPSGGVGPSSGQNGEGGYVYTEGDDLNKGDVVILQSNSLDAAAYNLNLDFFWNKRGDTSGDLFLEVSTDGGSNWDAPIWSHSGVDVAKNDPDVWRNEQIDLCNLGYNSGNIILRIRAVMPLAGKVNHADMGIDKIDVKTTGCQ